MSVSVRGAARYEYVVIWAGVRGSHGWVGFRASLARFTNEPGSPVTRAWPANHLAYCDLATDRQQREYDIVQERHTLTVSRAERRKSALSDALRAVPKLFAVGGSEWVYNTTATIRQGAKTDMDAMPGADARRHVSVQRCKPCTKPHDHGDMPKYLPAGLTQYVLNNFSNNPPPRATLPKTTFRLLFNDSKCRRSPDTKRFAVEVGSSR